MDWETEEDIDEKTKTLDRRFVENESGGQNEAIDYWEDYLLKRAIKVMENTRKSSSARVRKNPKKKTALVDVNRATLRMRGRGGLRRQMLSGQNVRP